MARLSTTITTILKSKAAAAVAGVVLVGGAATTAAIAATHNGQLGSFLSNGAAHSSGAEKDAQGDQNGQGDHAHTITIEGVLGSVKSCPSHVTTIVVTKASESAEHTVNDNDQGKSDAAKPAGTKTVTVTVNSKTKVNGEKDADGLGALCKKTGHKVQVQATKSSSGALVAWKVTLQGVENGQDDHSKASQGSRHW